MNALFLYALSGVAVNLIGHFGWHAALYAPIAALPLPAKAASLAHAVAFVLVMYAVAWAMWRRRLFIKV
jgi:predicted acyltransferase